MRSPAAGVNVGEALSLIVVALTMVAMVAAADANARLDTSERRTAHPAAKSCAGLAFVAHGSVVDRVHVSLALVVVDTEASTPQGAMSQPASMSISSRSTEPAARSRLLPVTRNVSEDSVPPSR